MNGNRLPAALLLILLSASSASMAFQYAKFLNVSDIEKVTGLKGVTPIPKSEDADGDLNFARRDGQVLLSVTFMDASAYAGYKSSKAGFKSPISGVGEEGFIGPAGNEPPFILVFRKAAFAVMLNTIPEGTSTRLTLKQLTDLAKIIASRL